MLKKLLPLALSLIAALPAYADNNEVTITCGGASSGIRVSGNRNIGIHGGLTDTYNHANIACKNFTYSNLEKAGDVLPCTGFWNVALTEDSREEFVAVVVKLTLQADGSLVATYKRNWDARDPSGQKKIRIPCKVEER